MDQGRQTFRVRLIPHAGDWRDADAARLAAELNQPPFALLETYHDGPLPQRASYASDGGGAVVVTVVKRAEDGDALSCARRAAGRPAQARSAAGSSGATIDADFGPHEIKTFRVPRDPGAVVETNLLES